MYAILKLVTFSSDDGASFSLGDVDKSNTELSDDQNTSILSAMKSSKHDEERLWMYHERKIRKLVDKCRKKNIRFPQHYVNLSSKLAEDITLCTTSGSRGGPGGPGPPRPPDLEASVIQFGGPVYNLRAKQ